ncbi:cysteine desulfurase family protein [Propionivibrio dicarboxylicus]|uniref:Cysteine desulfurase n=1 Tax=Propionivibrio dicarboxylicus TaxID=83767 RepID=A0A1G8CQW8_9RHOO|nr:cysteine desulfurase family protein [Propionivibrio dicarboxylicus]SDH47713.1 cysteine desulfurase [Propionivibrio dicarboxylicus]
MFAPVYLDHNATTPLDPVVLDAMMPWLSQRFGNASSRHEYGRDARRAIDAAREQVALAVGAHATEVVFTSGGSEANNLFVKGVAARQRPGLAAISAVEHPCVMKPAEQLARQGWEVCKLSVDAQGRVDTAAFREVVARRPRFVSVMAANNETGVVQDIAALSALAKPAGAWFHADAVQALGKMPLDFRVLNAAGVNALTVSAHKIGGPQGAGALIVDKRVELEPLIAGGGHERGLRSGTENVAAIVGFGAACAQAVGRLEEVSRRLPALRQRIEAGLADIGAVVFGAEAPRLPNTVLFSIPGIEGETLVGQLDRAGFAVASGAACSSANPEPSHVLQAMAVPPVLARGAVRVSLGVANTEQHMDDFLLTLQETVSKLRRLSAIAV